MAITFRPGGNSGPVSIRTAYGELEFGVGQFCEGVRRDDGQYQLRTLSYRYTIGKPGESEPLFRWEYVRSPEEGKHYARHHFQSPQPTGLERDGRATLYQELHLPTGWVAIEEVIRFCLNDLSATTRLKPEEWHRLLTDSHERFATGV